MHIIYRPFNRILAVPVVLCAAFIVVGAGCSKQAATTEEAPVVAPRAAETKQASPPTMAVVTPTEGRKLRDNIYVLRSLLREVSRAELSEGGLFIDLGTPDQHKYLRGGWHAGWKSGGSINGISARPQKTAKIRLFDWSGKTTAIVVRARSRFSGQRITLYVDGKAVSTQEVDKEWTEARFSLPSGLAQGRHMLTLAHVKAPNDDPQTEIDWIWFSEQSNLNTPKPQKVGNRDFGRPRKSLIADGGRRFSYYFAVPPKSAFVFDYGAAETTTFTVNVADETGVLKKAFEEIVDGGQWHEGRVDLSPWQGELVRLELGTSGSGEAGWGEPQIVRDGKRPEVPIVAPSTQASNVIQILIDTVRQDAFTAFNPKTRVKTPSMSAFVKEAVRFSNAYVQAPWTKPSIATLLTGMYPQTHATKEQNAVLPENAQMLSEHLKQNGFQTAAFIANGYVSDKFGFKKGWDSYRNYIREERISRAEAVYDDAIRWLKQHSKNGRFYLYVHTIDPHVPYRVHGKERTPYYKGLYKGRFKGALAGEAAHKISTGKLKISEDERRWIRALYDGEVTYHDVHFGRFMNYLAQAGHLEDTLIVLSNDHGEEQFDHGGIGHGHSLYEELIRSPLVVRYPKLLPKDVTVERPVGVIDLPPTILDFLAVRPMEDLEGRSMLPVIFDGGEHGLDYEVAEFGKDQRSIRLGRYKLIASRGNGRLYDLTVDRGETNNLIDKRFLAHRACEIYLAEAIATPRKMARLSGKAGAVGRTKQFKASDVKMDSSLKKQLEALGYIN